MMPHAIDSQAGTLASALAHPGTNAPEAARADRRVIPDRRAAYRLQADSQDFEDSQFVRRTLLVVGLVIFTGLMLTAIWYASDVFLVLFAGILIAVLLRAPTNWLIERAALREGAALTLSILALALLVGAVVYLFAVPMAEQIGQLLDQLPRSLVRMRQWMRQHEWAKPLQPMVAELTRMRFDFQTLGRAQGIISSTVSALGGAGVALFIGIYLAAQPRLYQRGVMHMLPRKRRPRAYEVMDEIGGVLRAWLVGRMITMTVVGVAAGVGLWWLEVPLAFTLGVLSGVLEFIPYIGPILSAAAPLLIAFNIDTQLAIYVGLLFIAIQTAENYLLTPLVEQRAVSLPPALVIFGTLLLAALAGPLGVVLASPLIAACMVSVKLLYVEDVVEQPKPKV